MKKTGYVIAMCWVWVWSETAAQSLFTLENEDLRVQVSATGAELKSIQSPKEGLEYLWQADRAYWGESSPILFPVIGVSHENAYLQDGVKYPMPLHGFAKAHEWRCVYQQDDSLAFELRASAKTRKLYPFDFVLLVAYKMAHNRLQVHYWVQNQGNTVMPFVIGGHPGFNCPLGDIGDRSDYTLVFEKEETLYRYYLAKAQPDSALFLNHQQSIAISNELFETGAIILKNLRSSWVGLQRPDGTLYLKMHRAQFPYLAIWTQAREGANFICLEPWSGLPGSRESLQQISDKEGAVLLAPGGQHALMYEMEVEKSP